MRLVTVLLTLAASLAPVTPVDARPDPPGSSREVLTALRVLHGWDARRARAWAAADEDALRALYVRGSSAGRSDVRLLRSYTARGLVVRRLVTQVFAVQPLRIGGDRLVLRVHDRVAGGVLADRGQARALRSSRPVVRVVAFRRVDGVWQVADVR